MKVYLDHNATSPASLEHLQEVLNIVSRAQGNPSSPHEVGRSASVVITNARKSLAAAIGFDVSEIVFVSGASEANNLGTYGVLLAKNTPLKNQHAIASSFEHPSIREPLDALAQREGLSVTKVVSSADGFINVTDIVKAITPETTLISLMAANNEIGTIQPLQEFAEWLHAKRWAKPKASDEPHPFDEFLAPNVSGDVLRNLHFHVDGVQIFGKVPAEQWTSLGMDSISMSAHKLGGLAGIGALALRRGRRFQPLTLGGAQERNRRGGTENIAGIVSFGLVAAEMTKTEWWKGVDALREKRNQLFQELVRLPGLTSTVGKCERVLPNTLHFIVTSPHLKGEDVLMQLDMRGIYASSGSACSSGANLPSKVVLALGRSEEEAKNSLRLSLGRTTGETELAYVTEVFRSLFAR